MSQSDNEIGIIISGRDLTADAINSAKKGMQGLGDETVKHGAKSSSALTGVGFAARTMARDLGVGGESARFLGRAATELASTLSGAALGFAATTLAGVGLYQVYRSFSEVHEKLRDAQIKTGQSLAEEAIGMQRNREETESLRVAKYNLYVEIDRLARTNLSISMNNQNEVIDNNKKKVNELWEAYEKVNATRIPLLMGAHPAILGGLGVKLDAAQRELDEALLKKKKLEIQMLELGGNTQSKSQFEDKGKKIAADRYNGELEYMKAIDALWTTQDRNYEGHLDMQLAIFDMAATEKLHNMQIDGVRTDIVKDKAMVMDIQRMTFIAAEEDRLRREKLEKDKAAAMQKMAMDKLVTGMAINLASDLVLFAFQANKKGAEEKKRYAEYSVIVSTAAGIARALSDYAYPYSLIIGGLVAAAGAVQLSAVRQLSYGDSLGAASSGVGGLSGGENGGYKYFQYEQSRHGTGWRPGEGQGQFGEQMTIVNQGTIITLDSDEFQKYVSKAWVASVQNNEHNVNSTAKKYL